jgi:hypothetical protein
LFLAALSPSLEGNCIQIDGALIVEQMLRNGAHKLMSIDLRRNYIHSNEVQYHTTMQSIKTSTVPCDFSLKFLLLKGRYKRGSSLSDGGEADGEKKESCDEFVNFADIFADEIYVHICAYLRRRRSVKV